MRRFRQAWGIVAALWLCHGMAKAQTWVDEVVAPPFVCRSEFVLDARDKEMLGELGDLEDDLKHVLGIAASGRAVDLYLFRDKDSYRAFLAQHYPDLPFRRALFVKSGIRAAVFAFRSEELAVDLRHEGTHALLHAALPMVPMWLDEGLAEYFEVTSVLRAGGHPHLSAVRWRARLGLLPNLRRLESLRDLAQMEESHYREAWAWVHFCLHGSPAASEEMRAMLAEIAGGGDPGLLSRRLESRMARPERFLAAHFKSWPDTAMTPADSASHVSWASFDSLPHQVNSLEKRASAADSFSVVPSLTPIATLPDGKRVGGGAHWPAPTRRLP